ncbi:hypothetical protein [Rhodanobacter aciditrophus]|uniref:hypothetical protein n=1 Tax=Rhodanobacter aciditrophus TaxID=1623218 RepID=UPI003CF5E673
MRKNRPLVAVLATLGLAPCVSHAGASLLVDDAGTTAGGHCQLESWLRARPGTLEATAMPACAWSGLEYSLGAGRSSDAAQGATLYAGLKHTLVDMGDRTPGLAVALNGDWQHGFDAASAYLAASLPLGRRLTLQADLGARRLRHDDGRPLAGAGLEYLAGQRWSWLAEVYSEGAAYRAVQGGVRVRLPGALSVDMLAGRDNAGRWLTLGLNWSPGDR